MKTLHLNLTKQWFDLIVSGEKKEEYREIKDYWVSRFVGYLVCSHFGLGSHVETIKSLAYDEIVFDFDFDTITFSNGYAKNRRQVVLKSKGISIDKGKASWGALENEFYFKIDLGKIISKNF